MQSQKIRIRLKAYDHKLLDVSVGEIVETQKDRCPCGRADSAANVINKYCVLRGRTLIKSPGISLRFGLTNV